MLDAELLLSQNMIVQKDIDIIYYFLQNLLIFTYYKRREGDSFLLYKLQWYSEW